MNDKEFKAVEFARDFHEGQLDDEGKDYVDAHLLPVFHAVCWLTTDETTRIASLLHDVLEDTEATHDDVRIAFGKKVADLVLEVTHEGNKTDGFFFPRLQSKEAFLIKLVDRASNISRMNNWSEKRQTHYLKNSVFWRTERK